MKQGQKVRLTKVVDDLDGNHPNRIDKGYVAEGRLTIDIQVGASVWLQYGLSDTGFHTSTVISIDHSNNTFKTLNSTYKVEIL